MSRIQGKQQSKGLLKNKESAQVWKQVDDEEGENNACQVLNVSFLSESSSGPVPGGHFLSRKPAGPAAGGGTAWA